MKVVENVTIHWPSGLETVIENPEIDQYHSVSEAPCLVDLEITSTAVGFCPGESITVSAPEGFTSYFWSNGTKE